MRVAAILFLLGLVAAPALGLSFRRSRTAARKAVVQAPPSLPKPAVPKPGADAVLPSAVRLAGLFSELDAAIAKAGPLVEGDVGQEPAEIEAYTQLASQPWVKTICETGFNAGHSALLLLAANPNAQLISFDLGQYGYTQAGKAWMEKKFGKERFRFIQGDSTKTLPALHLVEPEVQCDLAIVDGGHTIEVARADLENFRKMTNPKQNFVVVDDAPCDVGVCYGPYMALQEAAKDGRVSLLEEVVLGNLPKPFNMRGFSVGKYLKNN